MAMANEGLAAGGASPLWLLLDDDLLSVVVKHVPAGMLPVLSRVETRTHRLCRDRLARLKRLTQLGRTLVLAGNQRHPHAAAKLSAEQVLHGRGYCDLSMRGLGAEDMEIFAAGCNSGALPNIDHINLRHNPLGDAGLTPLISLFSNGLWPNLVFLGLYNTKITSTGIAALASACSDPVVLPRLDYLTLHGNEYDDANASAAALTTAFARRGVAVAEFIDGGQVIDAAIGAAGNLHRARRDRAIAPTNGWARVILGLA